MIYIYDGGPLSVTEEKEKEKDFYSSSIRLGYTCIIDTWLIGTCFIDTCIIDASYIQAS